MSKDTQSAEKAATPITDSPWFWFALFSAVGLAALLATGGKFGKRQAGIENKYQARAAVASGKLQISERGNGAKAIAGAPEYTAPGRTAVPLWPLEILLGVVCAASIALCVRQRLHEGARARPNAPSR